MRRINSLCFCRYYNHYLFTYKLTNISLNTQLKELLPVLFLSFSMGGLVYGSIFYLRMLGFNCL